MTTGRAASIHARLLNRAKERGDDFNLLLTRYGNERLLYGLSQLPAREVLLLKGTLLFDLWFDVPHRPTRDADFLGFGPKDAEALARHNPELPPEALDDAYRKVMRVDAPTLLERNRSCQRMLVDSVTVEFRRQDGAIAGGRVRLIDFDVPDNNDWLALNQFTVAEGQYTRQPDVVLFVNGLPLGVIELKNPAGENATIWSAFQQLQTYQAQTPAPFNTNAAAARIPTTLPVNAFQAASRLR